MVFLLIRFDAKSKLVSERLSLVAKGREPKRLSVHKTRRMRLHEMYEFGCSLFEVKGVLVPYEDRAVLQSIFAFKYDDGIR